MAEATSEDRICEVCHQQPCIGTRYEMYFWASSYEILNLTPCEVNKIEDETNQAAEDSI